jgi:rhodanese-related sulfurtransferase
MSFFSLFGEGKIKNALRNGAVVIDIRLPNEFDSGKVSDSINIPLERFSINTERLKNMKLPLIVCSNSFYESSIAVKKLKKAGIKKVYNGGAWINLGKIKQKL